MNDKMASDELSEEIQTMLKKYGYEKCLEKMTVLEIMHELVETTTALSFPTCPNCDFSFEQ